MLHKMGVLFHCEECRRAVLEDETDWDTDGCDLCGDCAGEEVQRQLDDWFPKPKDKTNA